MTIQQRLEAKRDAAAEIKLPINGALWGKIPCNNDFILRERKAFKAGFSELIPVVVALAEAMKLYSNADTVLSGADYQMYATSSSREAYDDDGASARKALAELEAFLEGK